MMMSPNVMSIMNEIDAQPGARSNPAAAFKMSGGLYLGLAYSASIGGVATTIGTPPNLVLMRVYKLLYPKAPEITFGAWFALGLPISFICLIFVWGVIVYRDMPKSSDTSLQIPQASLRKKYTDLGPMSNEERTIFVCFVLVALLWFFRVGFGDMKGWSAYFEKGYCADGTVAIFVAFLLFCLPAHDPSLLLASDVESGDVAVTSRKWNSKMLVWADAKKMPWDMVLLFGGGFALANGFVISGLSVYLGDQLVGLGEMPLFLIVFLLSMFVCFLTEITSNTATSNVLLPIVGALAVASKVHLYTYTHTHAHTHTHKIRWPKLTNAHTHTHKYTHTHTHFKVHPLVLMIPAAMCCSFAFMLPMATPPNLLAFATGKITMVEMCKHGFFINIFSVIVVTVATFTIIPAVLAFDVTVMPEWALPKVVA
jgi:sodium-dependent dicarboxylate transporter 2/3/5